MQETSHNVEAVVDGGVNDLSTDKCKVIFIFIVFINIFLKFHAHRCVLLVHFSIPHRLLLLIIALFFVSLHLNQGPIVGDEPCLPVGDVALNVSSSKFDDVAVNASKVYFSVHLLVAYFLLFVLFILFTFF